MTCELSARVVFNFLGFYKTLSFHLQEPTIPSKPIYFAILCFIYSVSLCSALSSSPVFPQPFLSLAGISIYYIYREREREVFSMGFLLISIFHESFLHYVE